MNGPQGPPSANPLREGQIEMTPNENRPQRQT